MRVVHHEITVETRGHGHVVDLSSELDRWLAAIGAGDGLASVFTPGSTAAVTTIEFEDGALQDLDDALERIAPSDRTYHHDQRWGDGNGFSHLRAALMGPSLMLPVAAGAAVRGTWQQVVIVDCDNRARRRRVVLSYLGTGSGG
jgi:secondary thiamine-phosphate synthase enzyme